MSTWGRLVNENFDQLDAPILEDNETLDIKLVGITSSIGLG